MLDVYACGLTATLLGFGKFIRESANDPGRVVSQAHLTSPYEAKVPFRTLDRYEYLQEKLQFEVKIDGRILTPKWQVEQLIFDRYAEATYASLNDMLVMIDGLAGQTKLLAERGQSVYAAYMGHHGLELINKLQAHMKYIEHLVECFNAASTNATWPWPQCDTKDVIEKMRVQRLELHLTLSKCLPSLCKMPAGQKLPDIFGQTYHAICLACFNALRTGSSEAFSTLFPAYFQSAFLAHELLKPHLKGRDTNSALMLIIEPLVDLLELSGYGKIYAELLQKNELWTTIEGCWDNFIKTQANPSKVIEMLIATPEMRGYVPQTTPRDIFRTSWHQKMADDMRRMGLIDEMFGYGYHGNSRTATHPSKLIQVLCSGRHEPMETASGVFLVTFLTKRPEAAGLSFEDQFDLVDRLDTWQDGSHAN